ncbi:hypothetical protein B9Q03_02225 [Candidatus Marsarchaeota G2 archaeon OSP_D]|uniref:Anaphase-promoting complex subunit 4 WD40 domain-containing protein n=1 Tax=Candidatus Marsarchaeota G2 archaeon OSP_D TaxID=1978157 RepID=A0A2R6B0E0_9ARCH|nr:MAG: hypothetical protein B9Q03_02225 [Candidatus Marsarchaeota G2 archaeon OSP_D]
MSSKLLLLDYPTLELREFTLNLGARWACFTPDGRILCVGDKGRAILMDGPITESLETNTKSNLRCAAYSSRGELLVVGNNGTVLLGEKFKRLNADRAENLRRVVWSADDETALIVGNSGCALMYEHGSNRFRPILGAVNNLRCASWPPGCEPLVVGNAFAEMFVPTPNVYRLRGDSLEPVAQEAKVDLLAVDNCVDDKFVAVGYDVVLHEPRAFLISDGVKSLEWKGGGVYLSALAIHPSGELGIVATSHPSGSKDRLSFAYLCTPERVDTIYEAVGYGFVCASWSPRGDKALLLASRSARTYNV